MSPFTTHRVHVVYLDGTEESFDIPPSGQVALRPDRLTIGNIEVERACVRRWHLVAVPVDLSSLPVVHDPRLDEPNVLPVDDGFLPAPEPIEAP